MIVRILMLSFFTFLGANPSIRDGEGNTVLHLASSIGDEGLASLFAPNADFAYCVNNDGQTALDIAVEKGFSSFAEHLNNLLYESYEIGQHENGDDHLEDRNDTTVADQEDEQEYVTSSADEDVNPSVQQDTNSNSDEDDIPNMTDHDSSPTHVDDDEHEDFYDSSSNYFPNDTDQSDNDGNDDDTVSDESLLNQLNQMTHFAQTQTQELYQTKYALNKLVQENEALKNELAHCSTTTDTTTVDNKDDITTDSSSSAADLTNKSLAELNNLEFQAKQRLDQIIKAKEVASTQLEEEMEQLRTCVICKEHTKSVLLMPCRHLCCCTECGHLDLLIQCPLCREPITEKINVFS